MPLGPTSPIFAPASILTSTFENKSNAPNDCPSLCVLKIAMMLPSCSLELDNKKAAQHTYAAPGK